MGSHSLAAKGSEEVTTTAIYRSDIEKIDAFKLIPREPRKDTLHRIIEGYGKLLKRFEEESR